MSVKQEFVLEVTHDGRYKDVTRFADMIAGRPHTMDGVIHVECRQVPDDRVVLSRAEYDQMRHKIAHLEARI